MVYRQILAFSFYLVYYFVYGDRHSLNDEANSCKFKRNIAKSGFHRSMVSKISIPTMNGVEYSNCTLLLVESLPKNVYVDLYQVSHLISEGNLMAPGYKEAELEAPSYIASGQMIYQWSNLSSDMGIIKGQQELPIHVRYHKSKEGGGHMKFDIPLPSILVHCNDDAGPFAHIDGDIVMSTCDAHRNDVEDFENLCEWKELHCDGMEEDSTLQIPIGNRDHFTTVFIGTLSSCYLFVLILCIEVIKSNKS